MLITTCTHCLARFRVTPQQLNAKQGQVRCGRCRQVFSGFEALERFPDDDTGTRLLAVREAEERAAGRESLQAAKPLPDEDAGATAAPESPATPEPTEPPVMARTPAAPEAAPEPPPAAAPEPEPAAAPAPEPTAVATPIPGATPPATPAGAAKPRPAPALVLEPHPPRRPLSPLWSLGAALLFMVLAVELFYAFRGPLAQRYPALRPTLERACAHAGCRVPWPREEAQLKLEESELLEVPGRPNEIALGARIRNLAGFAQEYPHLEVTLTDLSGQAATRKVLRPSDYLGRIPGAGEVLAAGSELTIQLRIETPRIKATGYELLLFYP